MAQYSVGQIEAAAAVVSAGATVGIPLVLAVIASWTKKRDDDRAEAAEMREFSDQWQQYNLGVASSDVMAAAVSDDGFCLSIGDVKKPMTISEKQRLHVYFFKLTAMYQAYYAVRRGALRRDWAEQIIAHLAPTVFEDERILHVALHGRGYPDHFVEYITKVRRDEGVVRISRTWPKLKLPHILIGLAVVASVADVCATCLGVRVALASGEPEAEAPRVDRGRPVTISQSAPGKVAAKTPGAERVTD